MSWLVYVMKIKKPMGTESLMFWPFPMTRIAVFFSITDDDKEKAYANYVGFQWDLGASFFCANWAGLGALLVREMKRNGVGPSLIPRCSC